MIINKSLQSRQYWLTLLIALSVLIGCAHYPVNTRLTDYPPTRVYEPVTVPTGTNTNSLFVCLAFSGGGTRAAALAYGVMKKLRQTTIKWNGIEKSLLEEVDCISSVSGGSFTAAYYTLFGDRLFRDFRSTFLDRNIEAELFRRIFLNPTNWYRLMSPSFSRIDIAAELYHETIFDEKTFADIIAQKQSPFLIVNATNLANGTHFEFTQEQFDYLGSQLEDYPVARAVAASSAFPLLLSPIGLRNYPSASGFHPSEEYVNGLKDYYNNRRRYQFARDRMDYLEKEEYPYVHLMDGGLADNIGLRAIDNAYRRGFIRRLLNNGHIETIVIIVANARTEKQDKISRQENPPDLMTVGYKSATISTDNYSFETIQLMEDLLEERRKAQKMIDECQKILEARQAGDPPLPTFANAVEPFIIEVNFESIKNKTRRDYFLHLPTSFKLSPAEVDSLISVGRELLEQSPRWGEFLSAIKARSTK